MTTLRAVAAYAVPVLLLCFVVFGTWVLAAGASEQTTSSAELSDEEKAASAAQGPATVTVACDLAAKELSRGDREAANELLAAAGMNADNYMTLAGANPECRSVWILTAPEPTSVTGWESFGKAWDGFIKTTFTPLASAMAFVIGGWLALFVLARLLVEVPGVRDISSDRESRSAAARLGWPLLALVPVGAVIAGAAFTGIPRFAVGALLIVLAVVAVIALAAWLATLRVMRIDAKVGDDDSSGRQVSAELITARLRELAGKSTSIEVPSGPDVEDITSDLKDFSSVGWIAAVQKIILYLAGVTPWIATAVVRSESAATVTVVRNRVAIRTKTVTTGGPGLEPLASPPDKRATSADFLSVLIAAEILMALREGYKSEFDAGLADATDARSVALQYIASTWYTSTLDTGAATKLLSVATRADPYNKLARYSFAYVQNRHETKSGPLIAFGNLLDRWISERTAEGFGFEDELLRAMTMARVAAARNLAAIAMTSQLPPRDGRVSEPRSARLTAQASRALRRAHGHLASLMWTEEMRLAQPGAESGEADRIKLEELRFAGATLVRARMMLARTDAPPEHVADLAAELAAAHDATADDGERAAITAIQSGISSDGGDLFTTYAGLAYSLATELVCWERQRLDSPDVARALSVAEHVPLYGQFATIDPELATAQDYPEWKKKRERDARAARAAEAARAAASTPPAG